MDPALVLADQLSQTLYNQLKKYILEKQGKIRESWTVEGLSPIPGDEILEFDGVVGRFVTCTSGFQEELVALKQAVATYVDRDKPARPLNVLLAATPGSGKSFLIKELSKESSEDAVFLEYHVASFRDVGDLFAVLQRIQSLNLEGKLPFVLFDEVDGRVNDKYLFANLLAPLWDGVFHIGQERHHLGRAVLFFAASALLPAPSIVNVLGASERVVSYAEFAEKWREKVQEELQSSKVEKARDFIDRIDLLLCIPPIDFSISDGDPAKEYQILACLLVKKHFPSVTRVEKSAAWVLIRQLLQFGSRRRAESLVFRSSDPEGNVFSFEQLPSDIRTRYEDDEIVAVTRGNFFDFKS